MTLQPRLNITYKNERFGVFYTEHNYEAKAYTQADENQLLLQSASIQPELQEVNKN